MASALLLLFLILFLATLIYIIIWVYRDAKRSGIMPGWLAVLIVIVIPHFIGLIVYLILRHFLPPRPTCHACGALLPPDSKYCPRCAAPVHSAPFTTTCRGCGRAVSSTSRFCPYCSASNEYYRPAPAKEGASCLLAVVAAVGIVAVALFIFGMFFYGNSDYDRGYRYGPPHIITYEILEMADNTVSIK